MINIVYVDVYFCFNFLMDFFVLYGMRLILKEGGISARDSMAAFLGALYATVILIMGEGGILRGIFTYLIIPILMIAITTKNKTIRILIKRVGMLYFMVFVVSGIINAIYYGSFQGKTLVESALQIQIGQLNIWLIVTVIIVCLSMVKCVWKIIRNNIETGENLYEVKIIFGRNKIKGKGLRDTGNQLVEPITGKSVFIIEQEMLKDIDISLLKPIFIPFNSVGKEHGLMEGFVGDSINIEGRIVESPIIGIHKGKLSQENKYNMILPPNICEGESK